MDESVSYVDKAFGEVLHKWKEPEPVEPVEGVELTGRPCYFEEVPVGDVIGKEG